MHVILFLQAKFWKNRTDVLDFMLDRMFRAFNDGM